MKVRNDYVSNSSSSSFILGNIDMFTFFKITKQDIIDALKSEIGGEFWVYDLTIQSDKDEAIKEWGNLLSQWDSCYCYSDDNGELVFDNGHLDKYCKTIDGIAEAYGASEYDLYNVDDDYPPEKFVRFDHPDPKTGIYGEYQPLDKEVVDFVKNLRKKFGIMSNLDVLKHEMARFFVHFDDNEIWKGSTVSESNEFKTEYGEYHRVCEVIYNWLVKNGRVNPNDKAFVDSMEIPKDKLTKWNVSSGVTHYFENGKNLTWEDLEVGTMTACMHEG